MHYFFSIWYLAPRNTQLKRTKTEVLDTGQVELDRMLGGGSTGAKVRGLTVFFV